MTFTIEQVIACVVAAIGLVLTLLNIYDKLTNIKKAADAPLEDLKKRVETLENKQVENENRFLKGNDQFRTLYGYAKMFMQVQLAFVDFEYAFCQHTDYADTEDLNKAKKLLTEALTDISVK